MRGRFQNEENWPWVVWTLVLLNVFLFLWDRGFSLGGGPSGFADLAMQPRQVAMALTGRGDPVELGKVYTSLFLHASLWHLAVNMIFLGAFGPLIERSLGGPRFAIYYLFWGLAGAGAHVLVDPSSVAPTLGASGAIGGVLGACFLLFPADQIRFSLPWSDQGGFEVPAWLLLGFWFLAQVFFPQEGVANWAHVGGFAAGMITVLVLGGREKALAVRRDLTPSEELT